MRAHNLAGQVFGRLTAIERNGTSSCRNALWLCNCSCGRLTTVSTCNLRIGGTQSCGCLQAERTRRAKRTHGHYSGSKQSPTYKSWSSMIQRCTNPNKDNYPCYGGAGVTVCDRWKSFENFLADMGPRPAGTTLGRFWDSGNYEPGNCAWQTSAEQGFEKSKKYSMQVGIKSISEVYATA
jgi:hypothetical protein